MSRKRKKVLAQQTINIKAKTNLPIFIDWLQRRLFLLKTKFCFQVAEEDYILLSDFSPTDTGAIVSAMLNGKEPLGSIDIAATSNNPKEGLISVQYDYPKKLSQIVINLILDMGSHFNSLESLPQEELKSFQEPEPLPEEAIPIMEFDFFLENVTIEQFNDWVLSEYRDILSKFFPTMGRLLEIQLPKIFTQSQNHRTIAMEGRLYKHGMRGLAIFTPNPLTNQQCVSFEAKQLSTTRLHILCRANTFAIEHFREIVTKIEKNWPETKESVKRFLASHKGETVIPIISMGPTINTLTGEIVPDPEKYYRNEYKFKGSPLQFSVFISNYGKKLADKYKGNIVDLIEPTSFTQQDIPQAKAMFFPIDHLDFEQQKGVFGEITVQPLPDQNSLLIVEAPSHIWSKVQTTWEVILTEMRRQGWLGSDEEQDVRGNIQAGINIGGNVANSPIILGNNNTIQFNLPTQDDKKESET